MAFGGNERLSEVFGLFLMISTVDERLSEDFSWFLMVTRCYLRISNGV